MRATLKRILPTPVFDLLRLMSRWRDYPAIARFLFRPVPNASFGERRALLRRWFRAGFRISCPHTETEVLNFAETILALPKVMSGVVVEAGCFKGGSTAKFSLAADAAGRDLVVFDSFRGIPKNEEQHKTDIFGHSAGFREGTFCGTLGEVRDNVAKYGEIGRCRFVEGWFDDTMPQFREPIAAAYIDVDLVSSTKTCLRYLFPLLQPGGVLYSQDGHLPLVIEVFEDDEFWRNEVGCAKPPITGLRKSKLIKVVKPAAAAK